MLRATAAPLAADGGAVIAFAGIMALRAREARPPEAAATDRLFRSRMILGFVLIVGAVALISVLLRKELGRSGAMVGSIADALADIHASASALGAMHQSSAIDTGTARLGLLAAISTNSGSKLVFAISSRPRRYWLAVGGGVLLVLAASWAGFLLAP